MAVTPSAALLSAANSAAAAVADGQKNAAWCGAIAAGIGSGYRIVARRDGVVVLDVSMSGSLSSVYGGLAIANSYATLNTLLSADIDTGTWTLRIEKASDAATYLQGSIGRSGTDFILSADLSADDPFSLGAGIVLRSPSLDTSTKRWHPGHYLVGQDSVNRVGMLTSEFNRVKDNANFAGWQNSYWWAKTEPTKNGYDFSMILDDLDLAQTVGKKIIVRPFERSFHGFSRGDPLPAYINSEYNGRYVSSGSENIVAYKYWDAAVAERMLLWVEAMIAAVDAHPAYAGLFFEEIGIQGAWQASGWTKQKFYDFWTDASRRANAASSNGIVIMNCAWGLRANETPNCIDMTDEFVDLYQSGCGHSDCRLGGSTGSLNTDFKHIWDRYPGKAALAAGVEWGTYGMGWTPKQLIDFGVDRLHMTHMHWEPRSSGGSFTISDAITEINLQSGRINTAKPANLV